jgi:hypothetical protein
MRCALSDGGGEGATRSAVFDPNRTSPAAWCEPPVRLHHQRCNELVICRHSVYRCQLVQAVQVGDAKANEARLAASGIGV